MKKKIKNLLTKLGCYGFVRTLFIKLYYPYKNHKIKRYVNEILSKLNLIFEEYTQDYWLDYGTLLGFVREGKVINHDIDLDFGIIKTNGSLQKAMEKKGFHLITRTLVEKVITVEQYEIKGIGFDIFYYRHENDSLITNIWLSNDNTMSQKIAYEKSLGVLSETTFSYTQMKSIKFYGVDFKIPINYEVYLKEHFGNDYMLPNLQWTHQDEKNRVPVIKDYKVEFYD